MFLHSVFFYPKPGGTAADTAALMAGCRRLAAIGDVVELRVGTPAGTPRDVVDNNYAVALIVEFRDQAGHDAYQVDPVHDQFVAENKGYWSRVVVFDTVLEAAP